jgi:hypothetical protein
MAFQGIQFDIGVVTHTEIDDDGFQLVQHDAYGESGSEPIPIFQPFGRIARARGPKADRDGVALEGQACPVLVGMDGPNAVCAILGSDPRDVPNVPLPSEGSVGDYCVTDDGRKPFWVFSGKDGTWQLYIPTPDGQSSLEVTVGFEQADGLPKYTVSHPDGMGIVMYKGALSLIGPGGTCSIVMRNGMIELNGIVKANGALAVGGNPVAIFDMKTQTPGPSIPL